jgi:hypothetical protein
VSHDIIIIDQPDTPGFVANTTGQVKSAEVRWAPSHDLTPAQQIGRAERAERMLGKIRAMLLAPADSPEE